MTTTNFAKALMIGLVIATVSGCQLAAQNNAIAAKLVATDAHSGVHPLTGLISSMLNGANVTLADDAFHNGSEVIIEGPQLGRSFEKPHHFRLWLENGDCLLEHVESGEKRQVELRCEGAAQ